jgi:hypothetical protein
MSPLGLILLIILVVVLLGGIGPHFYSNAPWRPGYGYGNGGIGIIGILLIIFIILYFSGYLR